MKIALIIILLLYSIQALAKFGLWTVVPYRTRIRQISRYYAKEHRIIGIYDTISLLAVVACLVLLFAVGVQYLSFVTGFLAGMLVIQTFIHRFMERLPQDKMPPEPVVPSKLLSYAIQARPTLAWREIVVIAVVLGWGMVALVWYGLLGN